MAINPQILKNSIEAQELCIMKLLELQNALHVKADDLWISGAQDIETEHTVLSMAANEFAKIIQQYLQQHPALKKFI